MPFGRKRLWKPGSTETQTRRSNSLGSSTVSLPEEVLAFFLFLPLGGLVDFSGGLYPSSPALRGETTAHQSENTSESLQGDNNVPTTQIEGRGRAIEPQAVRGPWRVPCEAPRLVFFSGSDFALRGARMNFTLPGRAPRVCMSTPIPGSPATSLGPPGAANWPPFCFKVEIQNSGHGQPSGRASSDGGPNARHNGEGR